MMKIYEIGTGYTSIPAKISAATEMVVEELSKSYKKLGIDYEIIDIEDNNRLENNLNINEVNVPKFLLKTDISLGIMHKVRRVIYSICLANKIKSILKKNNDKIILHFHNQYNLFFFLKIIGKKYKDKYFVIYTNHSGIWSLPLNENENVLKKKYFQEKFAMKRSDIVFALNHEMKKNIISYCGIDENKIKVIANGVNPQVYKPLSKEKIKKSREMYGFKDKRVILQIGSIYENKGQLRSIKLLLNMLTSDDSLIYAFAGGIVDKDYYDEIIKFSKENGIEDKVIYLGMIKPGNDLCELYNIADYTILSSNYEAFCLVGIESLSCGVPVIINNSKYIEYGEGTIKIESEDLDLLEESSLNIKKAARKNVENNYTWDIIAKRYYDSAVDKIVD